MLCTFPNSRPIDRQACLCYDAGGNRTQLKAKVGAANDLVNNCTFDALDRITQITQQSQTGGNAVAAKRIDLAYDASDRLTYIRTKRGVGSL